MPRARYSIASLVALITVSAFALAALKEHTPLWASTAFTGMLAVLLLATLGAVRAREPKRTFWLGFAVCGWVYGVVTFAPGADTTLAPQLLTTQLVERYAPSESGVYTFTYAAPSSPTPVGRLRLTPAPPPVAKASVPAGATATVTTDVKTGKVLQLINQGPPSPPSSQVLTWKIASTPAPTPNADFVRIGKSLAVLAVGLLGGLAAALAFAPRGRSQEDPEADKAGGDTV